MLFPNFTHSLSCLLYTSFVGPEPADLPVAAKPRQLALGIAARIALDEFDGFVVRNTPVAIVEKLAVTDGLQGLETAVGVHLSLIHI